MPTMKQKRDETPQETYDRIRWSPSRREILESKFGWIGWLLALAFLVLVVWDEGFGYFFSLLPHHY
jgi:hypothetical protein